MKKLIPALTLLLISAILVGSSTFAWFSMNTTVTAKGMSVTAKTDNAFLIISAGEALVGNEIEAVAELEGQLYPVKPVVALTADNIENPVSWGTATSDDPNNANVGATPTPLSAGTVLEGTYFVKQSYMVGIVANSGAVANNLRLDSLTISDLNDGITVVVVCGDNIFTHSANVTNGIQVLADKSLVTATGVQVDVYIFIDGSHANVKTSNATMLGGSVEMIFSINALSTED